MGIEGKQGFTDQIRGSMGKRFQDDTCTYVCEEGS